LLRKITRSKVQEVTEEKKETTLSTILHENQNILQSIFHSCFDVVFHSFKIFNEINAIVIYIDGLNNKEVLEDHVLKPLQQRENKHTTSLKENIEESVFSTDVKEVTTVEEVVKEILNGKPVLMVDSINKAYTFGLANWQKRSIEEPSSESVVRGPREGFIETMQINLSLIRRKIKSSMLKAELINLGRYTNTSVAITYIDGLVEVDLLEEIKRRLNSIQVDSILESGYIEELIEDNSYSPFPQILNTERPDVVAAHLLEGRVAILVDGTPFVLIVPISLISLLHSSEDYYERFIISTAVRILRFVFMVISLLLPSLYVSIVTFHQEMIPTNLLISIAAAREAVPFPAVVEALIMEISFEALREAGVRLPKQIGSAVSIVGALVIGQAAVQAGLVSAPMVIVVALTGIASFMSPYTATGSALRLLRFPIMLFASMLGLLGIMLCVIAIIIHLCSLRSFGLPYLAPLAPVKNTELKDAIARAPWWKMDTRPSLTGNVNKYRQRASQKPKTKRN